MALFDAIEHGDLNGVRMAVHNGSTIDEIDESTGMAPLAMAAEGGHFKIARLLLRLGADPNWGGATTPLEAAVLEGHQDIVELLIKGGADVNRAVEDGFTPLMTAISLRNLRMVLALLDAGANPNAINAEGDTPLILAQNVRNRSITQTVERMGEWFARTDEELTLEDKLFLAIRDRDIDKLEALLEEKPDLDAWNALDQTPLTAAVLSGDMHLVEILIEAGASIEDGGQYTPLYHAVEGRFPEAVEFLLEYDVEVDRESAGETPLVVASRRGCIESMEILLEAGADPKRCDAAGRSALQLASEHGWRRVAELLMPQYSKPETAKAKDVLQQVQKQRMLAVGETAELIEMVQEGEADQVAQEIRQGAVDLNLADDQGNTLLMAAAVHHEHDLIRLLIEKGARLEIQDHEGFTALIRALRSPSNQRAETVSLLAEQGADINQACIRGMTPLMHAVEGDLKAEPNGGGFAPGTMALIELGADLEARDMHGNTVWMQTKRSALGASTLFSNQRRRLHQMLRFLENLGANRIESHLV